MDNKFFTFIKPYLSFIDNGHLYHKPFTWLYTAFAIINLLLPLLFFTKAAMSSIFTSSAKSIIVFLLIWIIIVFASWLSFQLWWNRKSKITYTSDEDDEFKATLVLSHLIQTIGEWLGTWIGIVGFGFALLTTIFLGSYGSYMSNLMGLYFMETGWLYIVLYPIYGFLIIVTTRFLAEQFRVLASIANNTKKK